MFADNLQKIFSEPSNTCFSEDHKKLIDNYFQNNRLLLSLAKENILTLFNACLKFQRFPDYREVSEVIMILKKANDSSYTKNYRPISIILSLARLFKKIVARSSQIVLGLKQSYNSTTIRFQRIHANQEQTHFSNTENQRRL